MSIQKRGSRYVVRWREGGGQLQRTFLKHRDAAFETDTKRRQQLGALAPGVIQSRMTLAEFVREEWWPRYAIPNPKPSTQRRYLEVWGTHLLPALGDLELRAITPMLVADLRAQFDAEHVRIQTQRKALMLLQGILRRAVVRGPIPSNPVSVVSKPRQPPTRRPEPLAPETVERIRGQLSHRDATMISYSGRPPPSALIFPTHDGDAWKLHDWQNWRRRVYQPAAKKAGVTGDLRVYRLRGSFVSLLLWEGRSLTPVADQAGHSVATLAKHYAGVLEELEDDKPGTPAADAIRSARTTLSSAQSVRTSQTEPATPLPDEVGLRK